MDLFAGKISMKFDHTLMLQNQLRTTTVKYKAALFTYSG